MGTHSAAYLLTVEEVVALEILHQRRCVSHVRKVWHAHIVNRHLVLIQRGSSLLDLEDAVLQLI